MHSHHQKKHVGRILREYAASTLKHHRSSQVCGFISQNIQYEITWCAEAKDVISQNGCSVRQAKDQRSRPVMWFRWLQIQDGIRRAELVGWCRGTIWESSGRQAHLVATARSAIRLVTKSADTLAMTHGWRFCRDIGRLWMEARFSFASEQQENPSEGGAF